MLLNRLKRIFTDRGFLLCLALSFIVLFVFFGKLLLSPNTTFFGKTGDAILVYYSSLYHALHNHNILSEMAMFYPYSESIFFTSCMPILTQGIKMLFLQNYTIGIINLFMLLSMPAGAIFLYLIFKEYKVNMWLAVLSAVAITYLSPQVHRLTGHYNLSYCFAIPTAIWLMIKFLKNPSYKKSIVISAYCFFLATMHMYLFIFVVGVITFAWISKLFTKSLSLNIKQSAIHYTIQVILPFVLLQLLIYVANTSEARTNYPWGFFDYYSNLNGVFYTYNQIYEPIFKLVGLNNDVNYEGVAFVGISAFFFCIVLIVKTVFNLVRLKPKLALNITGDRFLNFMLLVSILCLLFSFCLPFKLGYQDLLDHMGFLRQFRALGRFTWVFFYVINICLVVFISNISEQFNKFYLKPITMGIVVCFMSYDAFCNINGFQDQINYTYPEWSDVENKSSANQWVKSVDPEKFQAILPFPYFQVGSENLGTGVLEQSVVNACLVSIKTGLPMISVLGSRLPLERANKNLQLVTEPTGKVPAIFGDFLNKKDILIVSIDGLCSHFEKHILVDAKLIGQFKDFSLYQISFDDLKKHYPKYAKETYDDFKTKKTYNFDGIQTSDSIRNFVYKDFQQNNELEGCFDKGVINEKGENYNVVLTTDLPQIAPDSSYVLSLWVKNMKQDLVARTFIEIAAKSADKKVYSIFYSNIGNYYYQINEDWTLIEKQFKVKSLADSITVTMWNFPMHEKEIFIDNILLRPYGNYIYQDKPDCLIKNNRVFYK